MDIKAYYYVDNYEDIILLSTKVRKFDSTFNDEYKITMEVKDAQYIIGLNNGFEVNYETGEFKITSAFVIVEAKSERKYVDLVADEKEVTIKFINDFIKEMSDGKGLNKIEIEY